ncbi:MAG: endopeptidase La [Thermoanaerobaculales bacterium]|jgi:ATP-dependent Lon protease|nr:endopeptidase La [Thermoanaerobaculales bacterium]
MTPETGASGADLDVEIVQVADELPVLPLRDAVLFPYAILPLSVDRATSSRAVDEALAGDRAMLVLAQHDPRVDDPTEGDLNRVGCVGTVMRAVKLPDGSQRILVQGLARARADYFTAVEPHLSARIRLLPEPAARPPSLEVEASLRSIRDNLEKIQDLGKGISPEIMVLAADLDDPGRLADLAAANLGLAVADAQQVLECDIVEERLARVHTLLEREIALLEMQERIASRVRDEMDRGQREYLLRQQMRTIQAELGEVDDTEREIAEFRTRADSAQLPEDARRELDTQLRRLAAMHPDSAEASVVRTWLDWMTTLPWRKATDDTLDIASARRILDEDHHGLDRVKQRIVEFLAVRQLQPESRGPILCFVGPPGVGKTSLGRSIARALDRRFVRTSMGGVRDEAEIRGHRRTYVGALPGRVVQCLQQAGSSNPVFMLDEVDKIGTDLRGDPSSALLEVLDPEQNHTFRDHYLGVDLDLSRVLFITTANLTDTIQPAFLDRMETIRIEGYTAEEKVEIARRHLVPRQIDANGLSGVGPRFTDAALAEIVDGYTREAGVRNLEREIGAVCRKLAVLAAEGRRIPRRITPATVGRLLGPRPHLAEERLGEDRVGVATGLAYTPVGGDILYVEAAASEAERGEVKLTGSLGEVMKESAAAAVTFARTHAASYGIAADWFDRHLLHVHVPAGAVPKDGPSAGVTLLAAIVSAAAGRPLRHDVALTGELTLRGDVLAVGGIKEKVLAALRAGIREVVMPAANRRDLDELPPRARRQVRGHFVRRADEVLEIVLARDS